jgi:hypothetical protein
MGHHTMKLAQIEYRNAPTEPVRITLHVNTVSRLSCGALIVDAVDCYHRIASKPAALALAAQLGAQLP